MELFNICMLELILCCLFLGWAFNCIVWYHVSWRCSVCDCWMAKYDGINYFMHELKSGCLFSVGRSTALCGAIFNYDAQLVIVGW